LLIGSSRTAVIETIKAPTKPATDVIASADLQKIFAEWDRRPEADVFRSFAGYETAKKFASVFPLVTIRATHQENIFRLICEIPEKE
jgi:hypothetical protein